MSKNKKVVIIVGVITLIIVIMFVVLITLIKNNNIKKEKNRLIENTKKMVKEIEKVCKESESSTKTEIISKNKLKTRYEINDKKFIDSKISFNGDMPDDGVIEVYSGCNITFSLVYGEYNIIKNSKSDIEILDASKKYTNGTEVYFNLEKNSICNDYSKENSNDGVSSGCMKWYVFNYNEKSSIVTMILDHNTSSNVRWLSKNDLENDKEYNNEYGALTAYKSLKDSFSFDKIVPKIRLIKAKEVASIIGLDKFKENSNNDIFFDSKLSKPLKTCYKDNVSECRFGWLYDHTSTKCKDYGCKNNSTYDTYGYWTDSASTSDSKKAWAVYFDGRMVLTDIDQVSVGIRPVLEIQKSLLK